MKDKINVSITDEIDAGNLDEAFKKTFEFIDRFEDFKVQICQYSAQYKNTNKQDQLGIVSNGYLSQETNRIRFNFRKEVKGFRENTLSQYFDIEHFNEKLRDVQDQEALLRKIMSLRLEPMGFGIHDGKRTSQEDASLGIIHGKSAVLFPLLRIGAGSHAMAQVLRKTSITEEEKRSLRQLIGLKHRNVIKVLDCEVNLYPYFLIVEHVYGKTLKGAVQSVGARPVSQVVDWLYQLADALLYLNQKNIVHFNVRPSKLYIDDEFHIMISPVDFSVTAGIKSDAGIDIMNFWEVCKYGSPELLSDYGPGRTSVSNTRFVCAEDQYSLGLIAYYVLTGEELFAGNTIVSILEARKKFEENPEARLRKLDKIPRFSEEGITGNGIEQLTDIICKLLSTKPEDRYSSLHALIQALHRLVHADLIGAKIVQKSYRRAMANNRELIREFYQRLIEASDKIKKLFETVREDKRKMNRQYAMLQMAIDIIINLEEADYQQKFNQLFSRQGTDGHNNRNPHAALQIEDYDYFIEKLIETVKESDPNFGKDETIPTAWKEVTEHFINNLRSLSV